MTEQEAPDTVLSGAARTAAIDAAYTHGLHCVCGQPADEAELTVWVRHVTWDPEPLPWWCGCCGDCGRRGHVEGSSRCPREVA